MLFFNVNCWGVCLEARGGIEPPIKVLQTFALPLGDRASEANLFYQMQPSHGWPRRALR
jgi:hypothetical protein